MIVFDKVYKQYTKTDEAISNVNFALARGEMAFITGHSGAGKSTLLKLIMVLERATHGNVIVNSFNINKLNKRQIPFLRRSIGFIFQNPHLLEEKTVFDNVALPLVISGYRPQEMAKRVRAALDKVGLLGKEKCYPKALSGGEQQRVGIARAVVNKPAILLADEPTGNLDPHLSAEIMRLFEQFKQVGTTVLIASHDLSLISSLQHRILVLKDGRLISGGTDEQAA